MDLKNQIAEILNKQFHDVIDMPAHVADKVAEAIANNVEYTPRAFIAEHVPFPDYTGLAMDLLFDVYTAQVDCDHPEHPNMAAFQRAYTLCKTAFEHFHFEAENGNDAAGERATAQLFETLASYLACEIDEAWEGQDTTPVDGLVSNLERHREAMRAEAAAWNGPPAEPGPPRQKTDWGFVTKLGHLPRIHDRTVAGVLVKILVEHDALYHLEDDPATVIDGSHPASNRRLFTDVEVAVLREVVPVVCFDDGSGSPKFDVFEFEAFRK